MRGKGLLLGIACGLLFLWAAFQFVDWEGLVEVLAHANWWWIFPLLVSIFLFFGIKAERWRLLLHPVEPIKNQRLLSSMMIGVTFNYLLFSYVGEGVRTYLLGRETGVSKSSILGSILLERVFDVLILFLLVGAASEMSGIILFIALFAFVCVLLSVFYTQRLVKLVDRFMQFFPRKWREFMVEEVERLVKGFHSIRDPLLLVKVTATSLLMWLAMGGCNYCAMLAMGIEVPYSAVFLPMMLVTMGILLPNSPGHIGIIELCYVVGLRAYGVSADQAFAAGLLYHTLLYIAVIGSGFYYLRQCGLTFAKAQKEAHRG